MLIKQRDSARPAHEKWLFIIKTMSYGKNTIVIDHSYYSENNKNDYSLLRYLAQASPNSGHHSPALYSGFTAEAEVPAPDAGGNKRELLAAKGAPDVFSMLLEI